MTRDFTVHDATSEEIAAIEELIYKMRIKVEQERKREEDMTAMKHDRIVMRAPQRPRRYSIQRDESGHEYFVEVGMEGEFEGWLEWSEYGDGDYQGHDYEKNRIDGRFTFTDPRNE